MKYNDINGISSLKKAFLILEQLSEAPYEYTPTLLAQKTGINRTTIHRILRELADFDVVIKNELTKTYRIGPNIYRMGSVYLHNLNFRSKLEEILNIISQESKESVGLAIRDEGKIISLYEMEIFQPLKMNYKPGLFYPMNRGCYGKCLMAYYDEDKVKELLYSQKFEKISTNTLTDPEEILAEYKKIREQGFVVSDEEAFDYAMGVGIPIFDSKGNVSTCVAISFLKQANYKEKIEELKEILFKHADELSRYIP
ncbi:IclR family transcriptional regulator [Sedimentibacter sp.]|uniref:IclR family transcriptional regulator n=1 Tax=Sedimentibacter sp. TaxID=1960295 RepID=UPI0028AEFA6F|nr:IclR family transcriptional regulator [Sedimentibacter sp.]